MYLNIIGTILSLPNSVGSLIGTETGVYLQHHFEISKCFPQKYHDLWYRIKWVELVGKKKS